MFLGCEIWWARPSYGRIHRATPQTGGSAPLIKYPLVLRLIKMPQRYALLVAYKADFGGRGCAAQHRGFFYAEGKYSEHQT
jgi:hypothetical protein